MDENLKNLNKLVGNYEQVSKYNFIPQSSKKLPKKASSDSYITVLPKNKYVVKHATNQQNRLYNIKN